MNLMHYDIKTHCRQRTKTTLTKLYELDDQASFSEAKTIAPGQMQVIVTLPNIGNQKFGGISRDPVQAK